MKAGRPKKKINVENVRVVTTEEKIARVRAACFEDLSMSKILDLDEWADLHRVLPSEVASEHGKWKTSRFPFLRRIMKCLSPSSVARTITVMKGAQLGFTETMINWILYNSCENPGPMMYTQKTDGAAESFSTEKLRTSIDVTPIVYRTLGKGKPKNLTNSVLKKAYPGGFVKMGGANSTPFLRGTSSRDAAVDEEDTYEADIGREGSPAALIAKRQVNFPDSKLFRNSTPVYKELSTIEPAYKEGSQEQYYVPCPYCNPDGDHSEFMFVIKWAMIKWPGDIDKKTGMPNRVWLECPRCAGEIDETEYKTWMLEHGDWFSIKGLGEGQEARYKVPEEVEDVSFQLASFYSPFGFFGWRDAVKEFLVYKRTGNYALFKVIVNQTWGETWTLTGGDIEYSVLYMRRETYADNHGVVFDVPEGGLVLTCGVDVQDDRLELEVVAWGRLDESWSVDYAVLPGNPSLMGDAQGMLPNGQPSVWRNLDDYLDRRFSHECGVEMPIEMTMIDSGHKAKEVYTFCRLREARRIFAIKGDAGYGKGTYTRPKRRHDVYKHFLYTAHTIELKNKFNAYLKIDKPGPGFCHYPDTEKYTEDYFKALTCEKQNVKMVNGQKKLTWDKPDGARNEPIDIRDYAYVAFDAYPVDLDGRAKLGLDSIFPKIGHSSGMVGAPKRKKCSRMVSKGI